MDLIIVTARDRDGLAKCEPFQLSKKWSYRHIVVPNLLKGPEPDVSYNI